MITPKVVARQPFSILFAFSFLIIALLDRKKILANNGIDGAVLMSGNVIIYFATALSFWVSYRSSKSINPNAAVRSLYGSFMIRFFIIAIAAFAYIIMAKKNVNKPALMICMGLYLVYSTLEVMAMQKILRRKKNA